MSSKESIIEACGEHLVGAWTPASTIQDIAASHIDRYDEPWRYYHTVDHLGSMAMFLSESVEKLENPRRVFWAMIGHDTIYLPHLYNPAMPKGLNEELSAQLTMDSLTLHLGMKETGQIGQDILSTAGHQWDGKDEDQAYLLDADLAILGASPDDFDQYDTNIRKEFSFVDSVTFRRARLEVLRSFAQTDRIFITGTAYEKLEYKARQNLARKITEYELAVK